MKAFYVESVNDSHWVIGPGGAVEERWATQSLADERAKRLNQIFMMGYDRAAAAFTSLLEDPDQQILPYGHAAEA